MKNPDAYSKQARYYALASTLIFFFGEFMVTVTQNVLRNNALLAVDSDSDEGVEYWQTNFLKGWVARILCNNFSCPWSSFSCIHEKATNIIELE